MPDRPFEDHAATEPSVDHDMVDRPFEDHTTTESPL